MSMLEPALDVVKARRINRHVGFAFFEKIAVRSSVTKISNWARKEFALDHPVLHFANLDGFWTEFFEILLEVSVEQVIGLVRVSICVNYLFHFGSFLISLSYGR
jgi:hypothetical protein